MTGVANDDRATLVWNRRTNLDNVANPDNGQITNPSYYNLTDLDLTQFDPGTLAVTSTGGSDAADTVDTDQTITAANPMPGNGSDGGDNIEQIRSTGTGTQILKVKSLTAVDGATSEPFSIAAAEAPTHSRLRFPMSRSRFSRQRPACPKTSPSPRRFRTRPQTWRSKARALS